MKKLFYLMLIVVLSSCATTKGTPFAGKTKNKQVKTMKRAQVRRAQKGQTFYVKTDSGVKKRKIWHR